VVVSSHTLQGVPPRVADERVGARRASEALDAAQDVSAVSVRESARQVGDNWTSALPADAVRAASPEKLIIEDGGIVDDEVVSRAGSYQVVAGTATQKVAPSAPMELVSTGTATHEVVASARANDIVPSPGDDDVPARGADQVVVSVRTDDRRWVSEAGWRSGRGRSLSPVECESTKQRNRAKLHAPIFGTPSTQL